jgi:GTP-binding protein
VSPSDEPGTESAPLVAIVGRPNVGKSTLFNRLVGARQAIVEDKPGVTRDRLYGVASWDGRRFLVVDTGGLDPGLDTGLPRHIRLQAEAAVDEADLVLLVLDAKEGLCAVDVEIARRLRRAGKPVIVVVNKVDGPRREGQALAAHEMGIGDVHAVSAAHGRGTGDLCDAILAALAGASERVADPIPPGTRLCLVGRPNAGKSTLVNALTRQARVIVDAAPGTTRDPIHTPLHWRGRDLVLVDTAGLRRRTQVARAMEKLAAIKSIRSMERSQVVVLVVDAQQGVTDQDQRIARMAFERGKGVVVALHKWDLMARDPARAKACRERAREQLAFLEKPEIVRTSVTGTGRDEGRGRGRDLDELLAACVHTASVLATRVPTAALNEELAAAVAAHGPPSHKNRSVRLYFATQAESDPPLFVVSASQGRCLTPAYERYLLRRFRERWHLWGIPLRLVVRARGRGNKERAAERAR